MAHDSLKRMTTSVALLIWGRIWAYHSTKSLFLWSIIVGIRPLGLYFVCSGPLCSPPRRLSHTGSYVRPSSCRTISTFLYDQSSDILVRKNFQGIQIYSPAIGPNVVGIQSELLSVGHNYDVVSGDPEAGDLFGPRACLLYSELLARSIWTRCTTDDTMTFSAYKTERVLYCEGCNRGFKYK